MKRGLRFFPALAALLLVLAGISALGAEGPPPIVRVGYFAYEGFLKETGDGGYTGYGYDYREEVNDHYFLPLRGISEERFKNRLIRLVGRVAAIPRLPNKNFAYSESCGVYVFQKGDQDIHQAIGWADLARERAKLYPRDWVVLYDDSMRQETLREQVEFLKQSRCDIVQGYYYSKPLPADQFERRLLKSAAIKGGITDAAAEY